MKIIFKKYNKFILLIIISLVSNNLLFPQEVQDAFHFSTSVTGDFTSSTISGRIRRPVYLGMEAIVLSISTSGSKLWDGGVLKIQAINTHGSMPSANYVKDIERYDNIEAGDHTGFFELAYQQQFDHLILLVGQHDLNSDFASTLYCDLYLNSSFGIPPSLSLNIPVSIYPISAPCIYAKYVTDNKWLYRLAVYDGNPGDFKSNRYGINFNIGPKDGLFTIAEAEYSNLISFDMAGVFKFGAYFHNGTFQQYGDTVHTIKRNYGFYLLAAKRLGPSFITGCGEGLNGFIQLGYAPPDRNMLSYYLSGGLRMNGFIRKKSRDVIGIAVSYAGLSKYYLRNFTDSRPSEKSIELTYKFYIKANYIIQPDFQYILNAGAKKELSNAFTSTLRFNILFD